MDDTRIIVPHIDEDELNEGILIKSHSAKDILPSATDDSDSDTTINISCLQQELVTDNKINNSDLYFSSITKLNDPFKRLNHIKFDAKFVNDVSEQCKYGPYSIEEKNNNNNNINQLSEQLHNWLNQGISKEINVCTITKEDLNPIIKTGIRYNTKLNCDKINYILNYNKKQKICFDPYQFTYGIRISGPSMGSRHNACISAMYDDNYFDLEKYRNPNNSNTSKLRVESYYFHDCSSQNISSILQFISKYEHIESTYLFGYHLDHNLNLLSVSSFKYANIFFQLRLKGFNDKKNTKSQYKLEFRLILDRNLFCNMRNYIKLTLFILTLEIYKSFSNYSFAIECWQGYYESFRRHIKSKNSFDYKYIHSDDLDGELQNIYSISNAIANKFELYILLDQFEIEDRVKEYLKSNNVNLNDHNKYPTEDISDGDGEEDTFIQFPIDVVIWVITLHQNQQQHDRLLHNISMNKIISYFKMIKTKSSGTSHWSSRDSRIKHFNHYIYSYDTGESNKKKDPMRGLRKQREYETPLFYTVEHGNLHRLDEEIDFDMNACNLYHGPKKSQIGQHREDHKFIKKIWSKITGESSFLTIGGRSYGWTNFIVTIFTQNGCYIGYESQGFCMTIAGHGIKQPHLLWRKYMFRLCDLYRFISNELKEKCQDHLSSSNNVDSFCYHYFDLNEFSNVCNCCYDSDKEVDFSDPPTKFPTLSDLNVSCDLNELL